VSDALKDALGQQKADTSKPNIPTPMGGGGVANVPVTTGTNDPSGGRGTNQPFPNPAAGNESVKCPNNKTYSVSSQDIKSAGGMIPWCNRNGHYAGSSNFVGFDGKIRRPSYKVDFF
jgi:hypothetical protein